MISIECQGAFQHVKFHTSRGKVSGFYFYLGYVVGNINWIVYNVGETSRSANILFYSLFSFSFPCLKSEGYSKLALC